MIILAYQQHMCVTEQVEPKTRASSEHLAYYQALKVVVIQLLRLINNSFSFPKIYQNLSGLYPLF